MGLINNESNYRSEVSKLAQWCNDNNLFLNVGKTKGIVIDFRIRVNNTKFLGVHISEDLSWMTNTTSLDNQEGSRRIRHASTSSVI